MVFNQAEQEVKALQKELKRNIAKSRLNDVPLEMEGVKLTKWQFSTF